MTINRGIDGSATDNTADGFAGISASLTNGFASAFASAWELNGELGAFAIADASQYSLLNGGGGLLEAAAEARAGAVYTDFYVAGPTGGPLFIDAPLHLYLGGFQGVVATGGSAASQFMAIAAIGTTRYQTGCTLITYVGFCSTTGPLDLTFSIPVNTAFSLSLQLNAWANVNVYAERDVTTSASARTDFSHTLSFVSGSPVFTLPDGYTVNSAQAGVVNNRWTDPTPTSVPEPATVLLLGTGLVGAGVRRWRQKRT